MGRAQDPQAPHPALSEPLEQLHFESVERLAEACVRLQVLDLAENRIAVLPSEVIQMSRLKKLYLDHNQLTKLPHELYKLSQTLALLGIAENPLDDEIMQLYYAGLPVLLSHLKATRCPLPPRLRPSSSCDIRATTCTRVNVGR